MPDAAALKWERRIKKSIVVVSRRPFSIHWKRNEIKDSSFSFVPGVDEFRAEINDIKVFPTPIISRLLAPFDNAESVSGDF
jgi:hypothetical protein